MGRGLPRGIEAILAGTALLLLAPLLLLLGAAVKVSSPGPVLFRQRRIGRHGRPFTLLKLRTMRAGDGPQVTAAGDPRVTAIGRLLRRAKLDELPALWNVLAGDLSIVGPRPEVPQYVDLDDPRWRRVLAVRPGLTDPVTLRLRDEERLLASIEGDRDDFYRRRLLPFKLAGYAAYLERRTPWRDVAVILQTLAAILLPERAAPPSRDEIAAAA
ncbi:MAG: sugar transferase, partial [Acidobacteria bacterium]